MPSQAQLRETFLKQRLQRLADEQKKFSEQACTHLLHSTIWNNSQYIACYWAVNGELSIHPLLTNNPNAIIPDNLITSTLSGAKKNNASTKTLYLPTLIPTPLEREGRVRGNKKTETFSTLALHFLPFSSSTVLQKNKYGIPEPHYKSTHEKPIAELDLILLPLIAFDSQGHRIGMGAGYYDRTLENIMELRKRPKLLGCAFSDQETNQIEPNPWDIPLDGVVTENGVRYF